MFHPEPNSRARADGLTNEQAETTRPTSPLDDGSEASSTDQRIAPSPNRKKKNSHIVWSPSSSVALYVKENSGSGHGSGSGQRLLHAALESLSGKHNQLLTETDNQLRQQKELSSTYQYISQQSILLSQKYLSVDKYSNSLAISFFGSMLLSRTKHFKNWTLNKRLEKIEEQVSKLPEETFDLASLFKYIDQEATKYYAPQSFSAKLFAGTLLVEAAAKIDLRDNKNENATDIMARISLHNEGKALAYFKADDLTILQAIARNENANQERLPETLFKKITRLGTDQEIDHRKINFTDLETNALRSLLKRKGQEKLSESLINSDIYLSFKKFEPILKDINEAVQHHCSINTFARIIFESYLIEHIYALPIAKKELALSKKINEIWQIFLIQLQPITQALRHSTPLWQIYYLVWHHGQELLAQTDPLEMTAAKLKTLYINSNKNDGQNGVAISNALSSQLIDHLPKSFFKKDPITKVDIFKTSDELMSDLASWEMMKYPEYAYFFAAFTMLLTDALMASSIIEPMLEPAGMNYFYFTMLALAAMILGIGRRQPRLVATREISETLEIFSQKGSQLYSPSTRTETGNRDIESQHEESKDDETMSLLQTTQQMV